MDIRIFADGVKNPEGPISLIGGNCIITEMDIGAITHITSDGECSNIAFTGLPNGLAIGADGRLWVADAVDRALLAVSPDGRVDTISRGDDSETFLLPNDLCFGPDGMLYMTDSGILLAEMRAALSPMDAYRMPFDGRLYRIDPRTGRSEILDRGFRLTNGIAFGPEGEYLYVAETLTGNILKYRTGQWQQEYYGNVMLRPPESFGRIAGPDGMAFDKEGRLYVAVIAQGDVTVLDCNGKQSLHIQLPGDNPTNLAFDADGAGQILVTESARGQVLQMQIGTVGLPLYS